MRTAERWERQPKESARAFHAFTVYRDLSPEHRSIMRACKLAHGDAFTASKLRQWERWSARFHWLARADAWDAEIDLREREHHAIEVREMNERHADLARMMLSLAYQSMERFAKRMHEDPNVMIAPHRWHSMLTALANVERLARGQPSEVIADSGEKTHVIVKWGNAELDEIDKDASGPLHALSVIPNEMEQ